MQLILRITLWFVFVVLIASLILLWGVTPLAAKYLLEDFFSKHDADFVAESIRVNPFTTTINADKVEVTTPRGREFKFDALKVELDILPLFKRQITATQIGIDGLHLEAHQQESGWRIAGVPVEAEEKTAQEEAPSTASAEPWQVNLPSILLSNWTVNVSRLHPDNREPLKDSVVINRLLLTNITGKAQNWRGALALSAGVNGAVADLESKFRFNDGKLTQWIDLKQLTGSLTQFEHYLPDPISQGNLNLNLVGEVVIDHKESATTITASTKQFDLNKVSLPMQPVAIESEKTQLTVKTFQLALPGNDGPLTVVFEGQATSQSTKLTTDGNRKLLAGWENLDITGVSARLKGSDADITIGSVGVEQLIASQNAEEGKDLPALSAVGKVTVDNIELTSQQAKVENIDINGMDVQLMLDESRDLVTLVKPEASGSTGNDSEGGETSDETAETFAVIVNRINVAGESALNISDEGVSPAFTQKVDINQLTVEGLNTSNPEQALHLVLEAKTDKYSQIKTDTRMWPFKEKLTVDTRTDLQEINLHPLSPYIGDALGYAIESGQLDLNLKMNIDQGIIDGQTKLDLRKFGLGAAETEPQTNGNQQQSGGLIPLNVAVGMLQDSNDNIELDIPISGDVNSPDFGWGSFVGLLFRNALFEATAVVVAQSFVPYANVLTVAKIAGDQLMKMRLEPLVYPPQVVNPVEANPAFISELKNLLTEKTDMEVKACPFAVPEDLADANKAKLTDQEVAMLENLAVQRGEAFKDEIIADGKIKSSRILLCKPQIDLKEKAQGRLEFEI